MTQKQILLKVLKSGKPMSVRVASKRKGITGDSIRKRIHDLRNDGHNIVTGKNKAGATTYTLSV